MEYPPFWKMYEADRNVVFYTPKIIREPDVVPLHLNGKGYFKIDGRMYPPGVR